MLTVVAVLLAFALGAMFVVDRNINNEIPAADRLSNNVILQDNVRLKSGDSFGGKIIGQTNTAVLLRPIVYGQLNKTYTFPYHELKEISYGDFDTEHKPENPLLKTFFEVQIFKQRIHDLYKNKNFEQLEQEISLLRKNKSRFDSGEWKLVAFYRALVEVFEKKPLSVMQENLEILEQWKTQYPQSITVIIMLIEAHTDIAWQYRGTTLSRGISASGREQFEEQLNIALDLIEHAEAKLEIDDPHFYQSSIIIYVALGQLDQKLTGIVQKSIAYDPDYYKVYTRLAPFLMPRWGGYSGGVEDFANWASLQNGSDETYARVATSIRQYAGHASYKKFSFDWDRIKGGYERLLQRYPMEFYQLHSYTWMACYYSDYDLAKALTDKINYAWNKQANQVWKKFEKYYECQKLANTESELRQVNLHKEIRKDNFEHFVKLIDGKVDLNARNDKGETALNFAINARFDDFAAVLIEKGADLRLRSNYGVEPIHKAARRGASRIVNLLLDENVPINVLSNRHHWTPLHFAVRYGHRHTIQRLLAHQDINVNQKNRLGKTPLHLAVFNGNKPITTLLLVHKDINVNAVDLYNNTALNLAREFGYDEIEALLEDKNAIANKDAVTTADVKLSADYRKRGASEHQAGNYAKARELYLKSLNLYPNNSGTYGNIALIDMHEQDYEACLENTSKAIEISRNNAHAIYTTAQCLFLLNRPKEEYLAYYRQYVQLKPKNFRTKELLQKYPELNAEALKD